MSTPVIPNEPPLADVPTPEAVSPRQTLKALHLRGLFATMATTTLLLGTFWAACQGIFIALQVQRIDPENQITNLALVVGVSSLVAMVTAPIAGTLSDRTRTRIGGRAPWILAGSAATVIAAIVLASAQSIPQIVLGWSLVQLSTNFILTPVNAHVPDRVPVARRGIFSAALGLGALVGSVLGQAVGAAFAEIIGVGYIAIAVLLAVSSVVFALVNRRSNIGEPRQPVSVKSVLSTFWVNPVKYPNFALVFSARFLLFVGYFAVQAYLLYLLQDYIGVGDDAAATVPLVGLVGLVGMIVSTPVAGWLTDRIGRSKVIIYITSGILAAGLLVPLFLPTVPGMMIYSFVAGLGFGAYQSVDFVLVTQVLPSHEEAGKDLGVINLTTTLPQTIGIGIASVIVGVSGGFATLFPFAALAVIIGACLVIPVRNVR
ncbi:MFS transporter [Microbacterium sp. ARD31]|uniref:MFS transporter n=1 Tax=Microbacterium sp. ARD31 TaxID=2962576 RepID=UPI002881F20C|nr:MFS transporter [Microbacterium sp. ARD31]MDT0184017.1 MFS transporter [Microbacterium sp. ARD31]